VVGMRLGLLVGQRIEAKGLRPALLIKLLGLPLFTLVVTQSLGWAPLLRDALVLQAAAPTAMSVLLLAEASPQKSRESLPAAQLVLWSTLLSLISVPLWAWLLAQATVAM
jgi:predicted permease